MLQFYSTDDYRRLNAPKDVDVKIKITDQRLIIHINPKSPLGNCFVFASTGDEQILALADLFGNMAHIIESNEEIAWQESHLSPFEEDRC